MGSVNEEDDDVFNAQTVTALPFIPGPSGWQRSRSKLLDRSEFLLENELLSDVVFITGKGVIQQEIPAHKFVLAMGSPVFETMFYGPVRQVSADSDIRIPDIEPESFRNLLRYLYTDDLSGISERTVVSTLHAAKKYDIPPLKHACLEFMREIVRPENVFPLLAQAQLAEEDELIEKCLDLIEKETHAVINTPDFLDIDYETLAGILERDGLSAREIEIFNALDRWADWECKRLGIGKDAPQRRKVMGDAIYDIRFPLMSVEELANGPVQSGILSAEEVKELFLYLYANSKPETSFPTKPRHGPASQGYVVDRFQEVGGTWGYGGGADSIQFSVDRDILLQGCTVYGSETGPAEYGLNLKVVTVAGREVLLHQKTFIVSDAVKPFFRFIFERPLVIRAESPHIVSLIIDGPASQRGSKGLSKVIMNCERSAEKGLDTNITSCTFSFADSPESGNGTSSADGQIPGLIFSLL